MSFNYTVVSVVSTLFGLLPAFGQQPGLNVLYGFNGGSDGANPYAGLTFDRSGALYGTTSGVAGSGTVFQLAPPSKGGTTWTKTTIYSFSGSDGADPRSELVFDRNGALYGATRLGGLAPATTAVASSLGLLHRGRAKRLGQRLCFTNSPGVLTAAIRTAV
jgi:hypothetical protein